MHDIITTLHLWCEEGQVYELRIPKTKKRGVISGYFDDLDALARTADVVAATSQAIRRAISPRRR